MSLSGEFLKEKYSHCFHSEQLRDELIGEVLFGYSEVREFIEKNNVNSILEVGSGTGILLYELKRLYPQIKMTGLEPLSSGYSIYKNIVQKCYF